MSGITSLPDELLLNIFQFVDAKTFVHSLPLVCSRFNNLTHDTSLLNRVFLLDEPETRALFDKIFKSCVIHWPENFDLSICLRIQVNPYDQEKAVISYRNLQWAEESNFIQLNSGKMGPTSIPSFGTVIHHPLVYHANLGRIHSYNPETQVNKLINSASSSIHPAIDHLIYNVRAEVWAYNVLTKCDRLITREKLSFRIESHPQSSTFLIINHLSNRVFSLLDHTTQPIDVSCEAIYKNQLIKIPVKEGYNWVNRHFLVTDFIIWEKDGTFSFSKLDGEDLTEVGKFVEKEEYFLHGKFLCMRIEIAGIISTLLLNMETKERFIFANRDPIIKFFNGYIVTQRKIIHLPALHSGMNLIQKHILSLFQDT